MSRRGENIYKRKDRRWEGRYIERYSANGKAVYRSVYGHTYNEVKFKMKNHKNAGQLNVNITAAVWVEEYLLSLKSKVKISTYNVYERYLKNHIKPFFGNIMLRKLNTEMLQLFIDSKHGLSPSTIKGIFGLLKEALQAAYKKQYIDAIWIGAELPKSKRHNANVFTKEEQSMIEKALNPYENTNDAGILICLYTGLRLGELCGLKWEDINFKTNTLTVQRTVQRVNTDGKSVLTELPPKSECSCRSIPIPSFLSDILRHINNISGNMYVINMNSHVMDPRTYQNQYRRILARAGVEYRSFHTLRHTFSVRALEIGFDVKTLSELLGHADASITLKCYAHSLDEHKRSSMEKLGRLRTEEFYLQS